MELLSGSAVIINPMAVISGAVITHQLIEVFTLLGLGSLLGAFIDRKIRHKDTHKVCVSSLGHHLRNLQKRMTIIYKHPLALYDEPSSAGNPAWQIVTDDFARAIDNDAKLVLTKREHNSIVQALQDCQSASDYFSGLTRGSHAFTNELKSEVIAAAKDALIRIYHARTCLKDVEEIRWPRDTQGRWEAGSVMAREVWPDDTINNPRPKWWKR